MYIRFKSTLAGLTASMAALMLSYAFGGLPSEPVARQASPTVDAPLAVIDAEPATPAKSESGHRPMKRVLATPYLSVGRLLPSRGS